VTQTLLISENANIVINILKSLNKMGKKS